MAIIKCKMCGGDLEITEGLTVCECEYCGTKQTVPNVDDERKLTLFNRAGRLLRGCEFDKAAGVFESIVADFPEESEAYWGLVLCKYGIEYVDDPATGRKVPTCHRSGFDSVMKDSDFEQACENADSVARRQYREEAKAIEELRRGIIEVSGKEEPYDIFICYKETDENGGRTIDSVLAQDVYDALTAKGYRVFFSRITLEDKLGQEYEPYIFAALNSAKVMLAFGTDYDYYNAVWVKNEWSRFLKLMSKDKSKHLIPCYKGIDAYDMPEEFARLQAQDMGKVGAVQDLLRGIEKLLPRKMEEAQPVMQQVVQSGGPNVASLLDRGNMALEDGDWDKAREYYDQALNINSRCGDAYLGLAMADSYCADRAIYAEAYTAFGSEIRENRNAARARQFSAELTVWFSGLDSEAAEIEKQGRFLSAMHQFEQARAETNRDLALNAYQKAGSEFSEILDYKDSKEYLAICERAVANIDAEMERQRKRLHYQEACETMRIAKEEDSLRHYHIAAEKLSQIVDYENSSELLEQCRKEIDERERTLGENLRKKAYDDASDIVEEALKLENVERAANLLRRASEQFRGLGDYRDSTERSTFCLSKIAEIQRQMRQMPDPSVGKAEKERKVLGERIAADRRAKIESLTSEKNRLTDELPNIKGLFAGSKKARMEARIAEIEAELAKL